MILILGDSSNISPHLGMRKSTRKSIDMTSKSDKTKDINKMKQDLEKMKKEEDDFSFKPSEESKTVQNTVSTQKKNVLYQAFKEIRNRFF